MIHIFTEPEARIEPGHQWLIVPNNPEGQALATLLHGRLPLIKRGDQLMIPHDERADHAIVALIDELARVRYEAPALVQLSMAEALE